MQNLPLLAQRFVEKHRAPKNKRRAHFKVVISTIIAHLERNKILAVERRSASRKCEVPFDWQWHRDVVAVAIIACAHIRLREHGTSAELGLEAPVRTWASRRHGQL